MQLVEGVAGSRRQRQVHVVSSIDRCEVRSEDVLVFCLVILADWPSKPPAARLPPRTGLSTGYPEPVTNQVTTAPGNSRRSATGSDTNIPVACGNPT